MSPSPDSNVSARLGHGMRPLCGWGSTATRSRLIGRSNSTPAPTKKRGSWLAAVILAAAAVGAATQAPAPRAHAMPAPEVEYVYDVMVRRHYNFANPDQAIKYGYGICGKVSQGEGYARVMGEVKTDVLPNDEFAANYLVSYAVNLLCPAEIWPLRNSAAGYLPPPG